MFPSLILLLLTQQVMRMYNATLLHLAQVLMWSLEPQVLKFATHLYEHMFICFEGCARQVWLSTAFHEDVNHARSFKSLFRDFFSCNFGEHASNRNMLVKEPVVLQLAVKQVSMLHDTVTNICMFVSSTLCSADLGLALK